MKQSWKNIKASIFIGLVYAAFILIKGIRTIARLRSHELLIDKREKLALRP